MIVKKLELKNYKRFRTLDEELPNGNVLITGDNQDFTGASSNGAGKSAITSAISFGLTGQTVEKAVKLITGGESEMFVKVFLSNDIMVCRTKTEKSQKLQIFTYESKTYKILQELWEEQTTTEKQKSIYEMLGIYYSTAKEAFRNFTHSAYYDPDESNIFVSPDISQADKIKFFSRYFSLEDFDVSSKLSLEKYTKIKKLIQDHEDSIVYLKNQVVHEFDLGDGGVMRVKEYLKKLKVYKEKIDLKYKDALDNERELRVPLDVMEKITNVSDEISNLETAIDTALRDQALYTTKLENTEDKIRTRESLNKQLSSKVEEYKSTIPDSVDLNISLSQALELRGEDELRTESHNLVTLRHALTESQKCPKCSTELVVKNRVLTIRDEGEITKLKVEIQEKEKLIQELKDKDEMWGNVIAYLESVNSESEGKSLLQSYKEDLDTLANVMETCKNTVTTNKKYLVGKQKNKEKLMEKLGNSELWGKAKQLVSDLKKELADCYKDIGSTEETISSNARYTKDIKHLEEQVDSERETMGIYKYWNQAFKHIKSLILDQKLNILESITNENLAKVGIPYTFSISSTKEAKSTSNIQFKLNIQVTDENGDTRDLTDYSKGERTRVIVAMILSLKSIIKNNISFSVFDEYLNMLDEIGEVKLAKTLENIKGQNLIISNSSSLQNNWTNKILLVTRNRGISYVNATK